MKTANLKTTLTGIGSAVFSILTVMALVPAQIGDLSTILPEKYKGWIIIVGSVGAFGLRIWHSVAVKDAQVTGGTIIQDSQGKVAAETNQAPAPTKPTPDVK